MLRNYFTGPVQFMCLLILACLICIVRYAWFPEEGDPPQAALMLFLVATCLALVLIIQLRQSWISEAVVALRTADKLVQAMCAELHKHGSKNVIWNETAKQWAYMPSESDPKMNYRKPID
jgi:hypothetical protein